MANTASRPHTQSVNKFPWLIVIAVVLLIATAGAGLTGFILAVLALGVP
jgi:hypothetical protein